MVSIPVAFAFAAAEVCSEVPGLVTSSILFCRLFKSNDLCKSVFINVLSRFASDILDGALGPSRPAQHT